MDNSKLQTFIDEKNANLEREAANKAQNHINYIIAAQNEITRLNKVIEQHRADIKAITVQTVSAASILGE